MTRTFTKRPGTPYEDGRIRLEEYEVQGTDGQVHLRTVVRHPGAVVLLALTEDDELVLIRNRRLALLDATGGELLELPAGCLEKGEEPLEAAARELREETGYRAGQLEALFEFFPSPGLLDERMSVFVARGLTKGEQDLDPTEAMSVELWPWGKVLDAIDAGEVFDGKTIAAVLFYERRRRT